MQESSNNESATSDQGLSNAESVAFACAFSLIAFLGIVGNSLVILAVYRNRQMRTVMNLVLVNLTVSGIGNLLACSPEIFQILANSGWILPRFLCPTIHYLQVMFLYAAVGFQFAVATERHVAITRPLKAKIYFSKKVVGTLATAIWLLSGTFSIPYALHDTEYDESQDQMVCQRLERYDDLTGPMSAYKMTEFLLFYLLPLLAVSILYSLTLRELSGKSPPIFGFSRLEESRRTRKFVVGMLVISVLLYFVSYSPIQLYFLAQRFGYDDILPSIQGVLIVNALTWSSWAANPILYSIFSTNFRKQFALLLTCGRVNITSR